MQENDILDDIVSKAECIYIYIAQISKFVPKNCA